MQIDSLVWLPDVIDKLENKHHVSPDEAEEIFFNRPRFFFVERGHVEGEDMYVALIISARDMDTTERRRYGRE